MPSPRTRGRRKRFDAFERIEIPHTHVPAWVVVLLVVGVVALLALMAFALLR